MGTRWLLHRPVVTLIREWNLTNKYLHTGTQSNGQRQENVKSIMFLMAEENHSTQQRHHFTYFYCLTLALMDVHVTFAVHCACTHSYTSTHTHTLALAEQLAFPDGATHIAQTQSAWISLTDLYF